MDDHLSPNHPDHPSNQLHDAAYPTSDYQPGNIRQPQSSSSAAAASPPQLGGLGIGIGGQGTGQGAENGAKFAEIAAPSLATTSARGREWEDPVAGPPSHLDTSFGPPPSYEQSQSQSRPTTASRTGGGGGPALSTSPSNTGTNPTALTPTSPNTSVHSTTTPTRPGQTYHAFGRSSVEPARGSNAALQVPSVGGSGPSHPSAATAVPPPLHTYPNGSDSTMGLASPYHKATSHLVSMKRRKRRRWCLCAALVVVFVIALGIGVYIGVKGLGKDDDDEDEERKYEDYQKFADRKGDGPPWVNADPDGDADGDNQRLVIIDWVG